MTSLDDDNEFEKEMRSFDVQHELRQFQRDDVLATVLSQVCGVDGNPNQACPPPARLTAVTSVRSDPAGCRFAFVFFGSGA